jgi:3-phenylpropionate/trans-cinnamate dioxygenase ferredoxin reductase subunit
LSPLVIVGASLAGLRAAQAARAAGWDEEIVIVGDEAHKPYTRPPLSKGLLTDPAQGVADHLFPAEPEATWRLSQSATRLEPAAKRLTLSTGEQLAYERLVIATGCQSRTWTGPGSDLSGLHTIRWPFGRHWRGAPAWRLSARVSSAARLRHRHARLGSR